jgi:hypothetical protein
LKCGFLIYRKKYLVQTNLIVKSFSFSQESANTPPTPGRDTSIYLPERVPVSPSKASSSYTNLHSKGSDENIHNSQSDFSAIRSTPTSASSEPTVNAAIPFPENFFDPATQLVSKKNLYLENIKTNVLKPYAFFFFQQVDAEREKK